MISKDDSYSALGEPAARTDSVDIREDPRHWARAALEAVLFVADEPLSVIEMADALQTTTSDVEAGLGELSREYAASVRGFELRQVAGGWRLYTREAFAGVVERHVQAGQQARLTQAALETLAIIAYRQPVTRARVAAIRGVGVDGLFRSLLGRGLIEESEGAAAGGAVLYGTTDRFLEQLGLDKLSELPSLAPLLPNTFEADDDSAST